MDRRQVEKISKALADETRLMVFEAISARPELTCGEIVSLQGVTPATVSHHLKVLQDAGLIESHKAGHTVHSRAVAETINDYAAALKKMAAAASTPRNRKRVSS